MTKFLILALFAVVSFQAQAADDLVYVGSCSWGNTAAGSCTHAKRNALASLYVSSATGQAFVWNRITAEDENYCAEPSPTPSESELVPAVASDSGFWWTDAPGARTSGITLVGSLTGRVQAGTAPYNHKQKVAGGRMLGYPTCFIHRSI